ncbi:RNA N6-adenosine-methyltransferase mettl16 [Hydra vulgaris]|uniref:U6 small nuclear RNA (adenine-(43)-N(6))-methyltransferase n=1 Tax=Hydra vulgaris TaxID=6087 RepID=A0ABM4CQA7_HYDVU
MHNRNVFKDSPPDFKKLMLEYPEFAPYVHIGSSGKAYVNFKDPASLRSLSLVLLKKYFNIIIDIPLDRLIPTIPLRLNYIHWIEDLTGCLNKSASGIDIGCGASCIYPLLGNKINNWKFIATEVNVESHAYAENNVIKNLAQEYIKVILTSPEKSIFDCIMASDFHYDFTICNPPFFSEINDNIVSKNRTGHRPPPISQSTASDSESFTEGGEVEFVKRMIDESLLLKKKIRWFTTMLGKKSSLKELVKYIKHNQISKFTTTEFVQGRTMRWGLAWTFTDCFPDTIVNLKKNHVRKKCKPFFVKISNQFYKDNNIQPVEHSSLSENVQSSMLQVIKIIRYQLHQLQLVLEGDENSENITSLNKVPYEIKGKAFQNTWIHTRQKKRKLNEGIDKDIPSKVNLVNDEYNEMFLLTNNLKESVATTFVLDKTDTLTENNVAPPVLGLRDTALERNAKSAMPNLDMFNNRAQQIKNSNNFVQKTTVIDATSSKDDFIFSNCLTLHSDNSKEFENPVKYFENDLPSSYLFYFSCKVGTTRQFHLDNENAIVVSFTCEDGSREQFHQMFLYLKNILKSCQIKY